MFTNTNEICFIKVKCPNREEGFKMVDLGNYFKNEKGEKVLITTLEKAKRFGHLVDVDIYIHKN